MVEKDLKMTNSGKKHIASQEAHSLNFEVLEKLPGSFWVIDREYRYLAGNQQFTFNLTTLFNGTPQPGNKILSNLSPEQAQEWKAMYDRAFAGDEFNIEKEMHHESSGKWYEYSFSPIENEEGEIWSVVVLAQDITKRKKAENAQKNLLSNLPGIAFRCLNNPNWDMLYLSDGVKEITGYTPDDLLQGGEITFNDLIHPDDQRQVWEDIQNAFRENQPYRIQYRIIAKDSTLHWVSENGRITKQTKDGTPLELEGFISDITQLKEMEQVILDSEEKYKALYENAPLAYQSLNEDGTINDVNPAWLKTLGYEREEVLGVSFANFLDQGQRSLFEETFARFKEKGSVQGVRYRVKRKDGQVLEIIFEGCIGYNPDGSFRQTYCVFFDITEQVKTEEKLIESEARYRGLVESSPDGILTLEPTGKVLSVNQAFLDLTGFPEEVFLNVHYSKIPTLTKQDWGFYKNAFESVLKGSLQEPIEFRWKNSKGEIRDGEARISPVRIAGKTLLQTIVRDITNRKEQLRAIEKSDIIINNTAEAVVVTDTEGLITFWNNGSEKLFGYTAKETVGQSIQIIYYQDDPQLMRRLINGLLSGEDFPVQEMILKDKSGKKIYGLVSFTTLKDENGKINELVGVAKDITLLKKTEQSLRLEQQRTQQYLDVADIMLLALNKDQNVIAVNPKGCQVLGYPEEEILGKNWFENFLISDEIDMVKKVFKDVIEGSADLADYFENMILRSDGSSRLIAWRNSLLKDEEGEIIGVLSSGEDITDRREAEIALLNSKETAERYLNIAAEIIMSLDQSGTITLLNPSGHQLLGYQPGELIGKNWFTTCLPKSQAKAAQEIFDNLLKGDSIKYASVEGDVITKTGQVKHISWHNSLVKDDEGRIVAILTSGEDITDKTRMMQDLSHSRELIFRLSEAARQVQNILDEESVFQAIGEEIAQLGYNNSILIISEDGLELRQKFLSYESKLLNKSQQLTGILPSKFSMKLEPGTYFNQLLERKKTILDDIDHRALNQALPGASKKILNQVIKIFGLHRAIYAPLIDDGKPLGLIAVIGKDLTEEDVRPIELFANQVSTALRNARYAKDLRQRTEDLANLTALISETEEAERKRLSQELHDQVGQSLALLGFNLNQIKDQVRDLPGMNTEKIEQAEQILKDVSNGIRSVMDDLRPAILDDYGLVSALYWYIDKFRDRTGLKTDLIGKSLTPRLSKDKEIALFRITQEALTNITRHARPSKITISIASSDTKVILKIVDDGVGFDLREVQKDQKNRGWGLVNIQERIARLQGSLDIITQPGQGTQLIIRLPRETNNAN